MANEPDRRSQHAFGAALTLHAFVLLAASMFPGVLRELAPPIVDAPAIDVVIDEASPPKPAMLAAMAASVVEAERSRPIEPKTPMVGPSPESDELGIDGDVPSDVPGAPEAGDAWSEPNAPSEPGLRFPLGLTWDQRIDTTAPPAPVAPPAARVVPRDAANQAIASAVRHNDKKLGLGNPEETVISTAIATAGRALAVPRDTRFRVEVSLDRGGRVIGVRVVSASAGDQATWTGLVASLRGTLGDSVQIGPDVRRAGGRVVVDAEVKHVTVSGDDGEVKSGACPTDPHTSGMWDAVPFRWTGGAMYGDEPTGTCPLRDATDGQPLQIQVRTKASTALPGAVPPPADTFGPAKKKPKIPSIWELLFP